MDHLPTPSKAISPLEVPLLAVERYDGGKLWEYPIRKAIGDGSSIIKWARPKDAGPFLQTWLFFGLMSSCFGTMVRMEDFVVEIQDGEQMKRLITMRAFNKYVQEWLGRISQISSPERYDEQMKSLLRYAEKHNNVPADADEGDQAVGLSIAVLIQNLTDLRVYMLNWARTKSFAAQFANQLPLFRLLSQLKIGRTVEPEPAGALSDGEDVEIWHVPDHNHIAHPFLEQRMLRNGWCKNEVARIRSKDLPCTTLHYLSSMQRDFRGRNHESCDEGYCRVSDIDEKLYLTQHSARCTEASSEIRCSLTSAPLHKIQNILTRGGIPIIACQVQSAKVVCLDVVEWTPDVYFIAFSHIWSDGRGNPKDNSLWECQLLDLCHVIEQLLGDGPSSVYNAADLEEGYEEARRSIVRRDAETNDNTYHFWIDTLCVPVAYALRALRKKAILRMKDTYSNAWAVIALDNELAKFSGISSPDEQLARIFCSLWMRRCWTLQELATSKRCFVKFSDTICHLNEIIEPDIFHWPRGCTRNIDYNSNHHYLEKQFRGVAGPLIDQDPTWSRDQREAGVFANAWNALSWRSTSKEGDRYSVLAALLNADLEGVLDAPDIEEKIRVILRSHRAIPMAMFTLNSPRQRCEGFGWAPSGFASSAMDIKENEWPGVGLIDGQGLKTTSSGVIFNAPVRYSNLYAYKELNSSYWRVLGHFPDEEPPSEVLSRIKYRAERSRACYIFDDGPACGARLSLVKEENGILTVRYDCRIGTTLIVAPPKQPQEDFQVVQVNHLPATQVWRIL